MGQAQSLARHLGESFELDGFKGLVSPYLRARRTAEQIARVTGVAFAIHRGCREWGRDCALGGDFHPEETLDGAIARVAGFVKSLDQRGKYVIVSHAAPVFMMAHLGSGADVAETRRLCEGPFWDRIANCSITRVIDGELVCLSRSAGGV